MIERRGAAVQLTGDGRARGRGHAAPGVGDNEAVRRAILGRLRDAGDLLGTADAQRYLKDTATYTREVAPQSFGEVEGIAEGYGLGTDDVFAYLHLAILADREAAAAAKTDQDGCSAWAARGPSGAAWVGKNRDFRGEHKAIQRLFLHGDPAWQGRRILCVGSLGAPAAYSSGVNSDGLALADTAIPTSDHGVGLCRYFLMTEILARCATVAEALAFIASIDHAGGGSLVLGDAGGERAAVELGHAAVGIEIGRDDEPVSRTNHFVSEELKGANLKRRGEPMIGSSTGRLETLRAAFASFPTTNPVCWTATVMASHDEDGQVGLCRHGQDGDSTTLSTALFATGDLSLYFCEGNPCGGQWSYSSL
jgi:predicted choloylglycine hydrolase